MGENDEVLVAPVRFNIFTRQWNDEKREWEGSSLKAMRDPDGTMRLKGTASSTIKDLHGDNMLTSALEDMEKAANNNLTIFGNHSYQVPEDVYGSVDHAKLKAAGTVDDAGDPIWDLDFNVRVNDENDRAIKTWKAIDKGTKLGMSIGAMIPPGGAVRDKKSGALTIAHVELLETSIVGIPANPRSWIENAVKAFDAPTQKAAASMSIGSPMLTLDSDTGNYKIEGSIADFAGGESISFGFGRTAEPVIADSLGSDDTDVVAGGDDAMSTDAEPDVTDAKVRVIEIDTGDNSGAPSQGASTSEPAATDEVADDPTVVDDVLSSADEIIAATTTVMASLEPEVTTMLQQLIDLNNSLTRELAAALGRERDASVAKASAERQRDEIAQLSSKLIAETNATLNKLADQPVGRRTVFREAQSKFDDLEGIYSRDFLTMLRSTK